MKRDGIKYLALLLFAGIILSLSACASGTPVEEESVAISVPEEPVGDLSFRFYEETEMLAKEISAADSALPDKKDSIIWGTVLICVTDYTYDLNGEMQARSTYYSPDEFGGSAGFYDSSGKEIDGCSYEYDSKGELSKVISPAGSVKDAELTTTSVVENGRPVTNTVTYAGSDDPLVIYRFSYSEGNLIAEERTVYADMDTGRPLNAPVRDKYEFDNGGHIARWEREGQNGSGFTVTCEYDSDGGLIKKVTEDARGQEFQEIVRGEYGRVSRTVVTKNNGSVVTHVFSYDDDGRVLSDMITEGKKETLFELNYNENGNPDSMKVYENGARLRTERYTYKEETEDSLVGECKVVYEEADIFGASSFSLYRRDIRTRSGKPLENDDFQLMVVGTRIRYVNSSLSYGYKRFPVRKDIEKTAFDSITSLDDLYPILSESYGDYSIPQPDGSQRLRKLIVSSDRTGLIRNVTNIVLDQKDRPAGRITGFDLNFLLDDEMTEVEENGREIRVESGSWVEQYHFANDMLSYTAVVDNPEYSYHSENEYRLGERLPEAVLSLRDNDVFHGYHVEYDGDGLLTKYGYSGIFEYNYSYSFNADRSGKLSSIILSGDEVPAGTVFMSFDEHGYLTRCTRILEHEMITFDYYYVEVEG